MGLHYDRNARENVIISATCAVGRVCSFTILLLWEISLETFNGFPKVIRYTKFLLTTSSFIKKPTQTGSSKIENILTHVTKMLRSRSSDSA